MVGSDKLKNNMVAAIVASGRGRTAVKMKSRLTPKKRTPIKFQCGF